MESFIVFEDIIQPIKKRIAQMKWFDSLLRSRYFKISLRYKIAVVFVLPMVVAMLALSFAHNQRERRELERQTELSAIQLGDLALGGLRHGMMLNDRQMIANVLKDIGKYPTIQNIILVNQQGQIVASTDTGDVGERLSQEQAGCVECHSLPVADRQRVARIGASPGFLRVATPISNDQECWGCHDRSIPHLGVLLVDASLVASDEFVMEDQVYNILVAVVSTLLVVLLSYFMIQWLIVKRVEVLYKSLSAFASGDFSARVPKPWRTEDEITRLADHFNEIAESLQRHQEKEREITVVRQEAVTEERERIARDLHDGIAQLLSYLNTKVTAVRLLLKQRRSKLADDQLAQMENAIQAQTIEVRAAIIGLKVVGQSNANLFSNLKEYATLCNRVGNLQVDFELDPQVEQLNIDPESEVHLLRITQEAVSNIRKHASATRVHIHAWMDNEKLALDIEDDGIGFDPWQSSLWRPPHFGLHNMGERAEIIGATFKVESEPGRGTRISVRLKVKES